MLQRALAVIEVSPSRLEVAVVRGGHVVAARSQRHDGVGWSDTWPGGLLALDAALATAVQELGIAGSEAMVIAHSPSAACGVFACNAAAGQSGGQNAALLALANVCQHGFASNPAEVSVLARDTEATAQGKQTHWLAYTDRDRTSAALMAWADRAGLRTSGSIPAEALDLATAVDHVRRAPADGPPAVVLLMGEHNCVLAAGNAARLRFVRTIGVGVETLVDALTRPMTARDGHTSVTLTRSEAREILWNRGVPARGDVLDDARGLDGAAALPLLQPVIQRLSVEAKQSMRFGLSEEERAGAAVRMLGIGSGLTGFARAVSLQSGLQVEGPATGWSTPTSAAHGPIASWAQRAPLEGLVPTATGEVREMSRSRRRLHAGIAIAAAVVATDAWVTRFELGREAKRMQAIAGVSRAAVDAQEAVATAQTQMIALEARVRDTASASPRWAPALTMAATLAPQTIRLDSVALSAESGTPHVLLTGFAQESDGSDATRAVKDYLESLGDLPIVRAVVLKKTERANYQGVDQQHFEILATLVKPAAVAAAPQEPAP